MALYLCKCQSLSHSACVVTQYVDSFYDSRMEGKESYYWGQLKAAVDLVKMWLREAPIQEREIESTHL